MNNTYSKALATIVAADKATLSDVNDTLTALKAAYDATKAKLQGIVDDYNTLDGPVVGARQTVTTIVSQLSGFDYTMQHVASLASQALVVYNPVVAPVPVVPTLVSSDTTTPSA